MESRSADCCSFPYYQLLTFWYADAGGAACYFIKVRIARHCCRLGAQRFGRISIPVLVGVVLTYQVVGTLGEWMYIGNFYNAIQDFRIGIPGMCLQVFGGYLFIRYLNSQINFLINNRFSLKRVISLEKEVLLCYRYP